jgi:hypothetical protein
VVRFTAQKGPTGLVSLSITAEWVALVYPLRKRLMTTCSRLVIVLVFVFNVHYVVWFALIHGCGRVFPFFLLFYCSCLSFIHFIKSCGDMFQCGEFPNSVLFLLCRRLFR